MTNTINTNIAALSAQLNISTASNAAAKNVAQLSSGNRIIQASDDVTALAIGTSLGTQVSALQTAATNAAQGNSLLQVADGALAQIQTILQQMQSVASQAQSGSLTDTDRGFLNQQFQALSSEIDSLAKSTTFNGVTLLDGSIATGGSNNPLRDATIGTITANAASTVTGFTATADITKFNGLVLDSNTMNDTAFIGDLSQAVITATGTTDNTTNPYSVSLALNGSLWTGVLAVDATGLTLDNGTSKFNFSLTGALAAGTTAASFATELRTGFSGATSYAIHKVATTLATDSSGNDIAGSAITSTSTAGTLLDGFSGSNVTMQSTLFDGKSLPPISNFSATGTGTGTIFSVTIEGTTYSTAGTVTGGTTLDTATFNGAGAGILTFYKKGDTSTNSTLTLNLAGITASARIDTADNVQHVVDALNGAFGTGGSSGGLSFQLGTTADSNVTVNIGNSQTSGLFSGATLDVSTQGDATTAATTVQAALDTITATRASVGALESRFNFATAAIQSSVQNVQAAQSTELDTDIAATSTQFATNQVKLQAGISVLAQANQQLQALLKLIG
jgi:flagellin